MRTVLERWRKIYEGWNWKKSLISLIILNKKMYSREYEPNLKDNNMRGWFDFLDDQHENRVEWGKR
jgi:hypothetical protein